ncbi:hypothetical protein H0H93_006696 [Arthromyces matolae]|nr:hypothetical protein H0H93_006696 [Arthromyces matolae]
MATVVTPMYSNNLLDPQVNGTIAYSTHQVQEPALSEDEEFPTVFCRALYDYEAQSDSSLSFNRGDIIEVLSQEPSGWWDGLLGNDRGWFPSNYVEPISDEEAERAFLAAESSGTEQSVSQPLNESSMVDKSHATMHPMGQESDEWPETGVPSSTENRASINAEYLSQTNDYWIPEMGPGGKVCLRPLDLSRPEQSKIIYVNTQTGERSLEIPEDQDTDNSDTELAGLTSQSSSRSGTSAGLVFGLNGSDSMENISDIPGFGIPRGSGTPEPWIRKLRDDGMSYFYYNKVDGRTTSTRPEIPPRPPSQASSSRSRTRYANDSKRISVYSDDSDVHPREVPSRRPVTDGHPTQQPAGPQGRPIVKEGSLPDSTTAERRAQALQQAITSPRPDRASETKALTDAAQSAIDGVVNNVQLIGVIRREEENRKMNDLIYKVVDTVRYLLYCLASPALQIPQNLLPLEFRDVILPSQSPLKPVQRKVTATLSRLVLSARALQYDSGLKMEETLNRIEMDAEGLKKDVAAFVFEVEELEHSSDLTTAKYYKSLHGVLNTKNIGLGLVGAGSAGRWKGFGWVQLQDEHMSRKVLSPDVISELRQHSNSLNTQFQSLLRALKTRGLESVEQVRLCGKELMLQVSCLINCASDIHVARHVDIDGFLPDGSASTGPYSQTVETAHQLVRMLEAVVQAVYNDAAVFLLTMQSVRESALPSHRRERSYAWEYLDALSSSLAANISDLLDTLDALLSLGHDQAEMSSGDYTGSIEWRMSRLSVLRPISAEEEVSMEMAFGHGPPKAPNSLDPYALYTRPHANSDASYTLGSSSIQYEMSSTNTLIPDVEPELGPLQDAEETLMVDEDAEISAAKSPVRAKGSQKLEQLLGVEYTKTVGVDVRPWYLREDYSPEDIVIDTTDSTVKGGTLSALIERLTSHDQAAFLMTFKSFMTVNELFDLLVARFRIEPPHDLKPDELEDWQKQKKLPIQIRVINTFVTMLKDEDVLDKEEFYILEKIKAFASSDEVSQIPAAKQVLVHVERAMRNDNSTLKATLQSTPPPPIYPKATKKLKVADIEPLEMARQLTLIESTLYQKIKPMECLQRAREQKTENIDNIAAVIQMSNRIADWVAQCVLSKEDSRKRAAMVKYLITVADRCRALNNFSSMIAITSGLNTPPIRRLKRTWEQVNHRTMAQFTACEMTIDSNKNFTKYRQLMASVTPPCVPFIGVFLSTLQFIQDGNPDMLPGRLVNFRKRQKASEVINDIKRWQAQPFNLQSIPLVQAFIEESLNQFTDSKASSEQFWALSLEREPREREDEKMARLLQESGFL